jgi:hypothetical protein
MFWKVAANRRRQLEIVAIWHRFYLYG